MGLLTDPRAGSGKIIKFLLKWERPLCGLLYISGIVWILLLALPTFNDNTYFSENALLPGLVTKESNLEQTAKQYYAYLVNEMKRHPDGMPYAWLAAKLNQLHLDVFTHNFTLVYPFQELQFTGQNIYGIIRAPRAASTEAIVVSVPFRPIHSIYLDTAPSVALLLAFAKFCRKQKYWAKDIIFLITEHEQLGIQAWLDAYHGVTSGNEGVLVSGDLPGRAGSIQAAINLEIHSTRVSYIDVKIEGLNGRLPNLDLFNLAQNMIAKEGIRQSFQRRFDIKYKNKFKNWSYHFNTLLMMIMTQATGVPTGNHGLFHRFGIEAITLEGFEKAGHQSGDENLYQVGCIIESIVRSLNNLLERFHQSYFFYLLPSTDTYISIGLYIRSLVLIIAAMFVKAFSMWQKLQPNKTTDDKKDNESNSMDDKKNGESNSDKKSVKLNSTKDEKSTGLSSTGNKKIRFNSAEDEKTVDVKQKDDGFDIGVIASEILWAHICGAVITTSPSALTYLGKKMDLRTEDSMFFGFLAISVLTLIYPFYSRSQMRYKNAILVCVIGLIEFGTVLMCIAMHNFSLALLTAVLYVPVILPIAPKQNSTIFHKTLSLTWILLHPFVIANLVVMSYTYMNFSSDSILSILYRGHRATKQAFVYSIMDSMIYGNWLYNVTVSTMLPIWLLFWKILCSNSVVHSEQLCK
ncbi:glycosylphosphatidylinositol anchor attachment 1 protein [Ceratina calcarata]|uniref:GPI-anchor transamidase component GPAA1 n=1 Tax=Ceratina calcarata TaxID=156304 RepID=A0AAJ7N7T7_9HYME|nr:glycosylphosphatidylinositol anchor attachment 1 protein [Ceratina calcarata]